MPNSFDYIANSDSQVLIIGTMPSVASLQAGEYYAHPRNAFWLIIAEIFNRGRPFSDFAAKKRCLLANGIALWDSLSFCERTGSLDSNIKNEYPNDFNRLLQDYPQIKLLLFNGQKAFAFFKKYHAPLLSKIDYKILPSTSPANAQISYQQKSKIWQAALER